MGYYNHVFKLPDRRRSKLRAIGNSFRKKLTRIKWAIWLRGGPVKFTYDDARAAKLTEHPRNAWTINDDQLRCRHTIAKRVSEEIIPWLHEAVMRSPAPRGIDGQGVMLHLYSRNGELLANHNRMVDKYGWRKAGRDETQLWLIETLGAQAKGPVGVTAFVGSIGRIIATHRLVKPYTPPTLDELDRRSLN